MGVWQWDSLGFFLFRRPGCLNLTMEGISITSPLPLHTTTTHAFQPLFISGYKHCPVNIKGIWYLHEVYPKGNTENWPAVWNQGSRSNHLNNRNKEGSLCLTRGFSHTFPWLASPLVWTPCVWFLYCLRTFPPWCHILSVKNDHLWVKLDRDMGMSGGMCACLVGPRGTYLWSTTLAPCHELYPVIKKRTGWRNGLISQGTCH